MSQAGGQDRYLARRSVEDRLYPRWWHPRYWHLRLLRDRLQLLIQSDAVPVGERLLDYGCGAKPYRPLFEDKFKEYLGADLRGNEAADVLVGAGGVLPVGNATIDCVLSSQVLEHIADPRTYLLEAYRVLKPGGSLILSTHGVWQYHPDPTDYWRWTVDGIRLEIQRPGFQIVRMLGVFGLASTAVQLWQDAIVPALPRLLRPLCWVPLQCLIGMIESFHPQELSNNASVFVVLACKGSRE